MSDEATRGRPDAVERARAGDRTGDRAERFYGDDGVTEQGVPAPKSRRNAFTGESGPPLPVMRTPEQVVMSSHLADFLAYMRLPAADITHVSWECAACGFKGSQVPASDRLSVYRAAIAHDRIEHRKTPMTKALYHVVIDDVPRKG